MATDVTTLSREGQITIPVELREEFGLAEGDPMVVERRDGVLIIRRATLVEQTAGYGAPWRKDPPLTQDEEEEALAKAIAEDAARYE